MLPKGAVRSHCTWWISHKRRALQRLLDRYGMYIAHLTSLASDSSVKPIIRAKLKGYLGKWKQPKVLIGTHCLLSAKASVRLTLQCDNIDIVFSIQSILKAIQTLKSLSEKDPKDWPSLQLVQNKIDNHNEYQGVSVTPNFETVLSKCTTAILADLLN